MPIHRNTLIRGKRRLEVTFDDESGSAALDIGHGAGRSTLVVLSDRERKQLIRALGGEF